MPMSKNCQKKLKLASTDLRPRFTSNKVVVNSGYCFSKFYTAKNLTCLLIQDSSDIFGLFFVFS